MTNEWNERYLTARKKLIVGRFSNLNDRQRETAPSQEEMRSSLMNHFILKNHYKNG